jgi:hypothetical protein
MQTNVAIDNNTYEEKVNDFLTNYQFSTLIREPTEKYQKQLHKILQQSDMIINKKTNKTFNTK